MDTAVDTAVQDIAVKIVPVCVCFNFVSKLRLEWKQLMNSEFNWLKQVNS